VKGSKMKLFEGDKIEVIKVISEMNLAQCKLNGEIGLFDLGILKFIKRKTTKKS